MAKRAVIIDILSDAKSFVKGSKEAEGAAGNLESQTQSLGRTIASAYVAKKIVDFGEASVKAAVEDAAAQKILQTALENSTGATKAEVAAVEKWIDATQRAKGVADTELRPALATLVASTKDVTEAQDLLAVALDTSRAKGLPLEVVSKAIAKAHDGNTASLTKLVPGLKESGEKSLSFATALERLNSQVKGQADAWAQTDEGKLARIGIQWDEMKESIGSALLPVLGQLIGMISTLFGWFNSLDPSMQTFIVTVGIVGAALYVGVTAANAMKVAVQGLGLTVEKSTPWLVGIGIVLGAIVSALNLFGDTETDVQKRTKEMADEIAGSVSRLNLQRLAFLDAAAAATAYRDAVFEGVDEKTRQAIRDNTDMAAAMNVYGVSMEDVVVASRDRAALEQLLATIYTRRHELDRQGIVLTKEQADGYNALNGLLNVNLGATEATTVAQVELAKAGDLAAIEYLKAAGLLDLLTPAQQAEAEALLDTAAAAEAAGGAMDTTGQATQGLGDDTLTTAGKVLELVDATSDLRKAFDAIVGPSMNLEESNRRLLNATQDTADAIHENTATLDINTDAGRKNREAIQAQAEAILGQADAMVRSGSTTEEATASALKYRDELVQQLTALGLNQIEIDDYLTTLGLTPENVTTSIELANKEKVAAQLTGILKQLEGVDAGAVADIQAQIDAGEFEAAATAINNLPGTHTVLIGVASDGSKVTLSGGLGTIGFERRAGGGPVNAGQPYVVGEHRPELFVPDSDGWILPNVPRELVGASRGAGGSMGGGGGGNVEVNLYGAAVTAAEVAREIAWQWRTG